MKKLVFGLLALVLAGAVSADSQTRQIMRGVAESLEVLLPLSLDSEAFLSDDNRARVIEHLTRIEGSAEALTDHGASQSLDFQIQAWAFTRAARRLRDNLEYLYPEEARYFLVDLTQHCVACHSRQAADREFPLSTSLQAYLDRESLDPAERASLQVALRQFDGAMATWEKALADPVRSPVDMSLNGDFVAYLTVAVRVQEAYERAARQLEAVAAREETPFYLRRRLDTWVSDLQAAERARDEALTIQQAREWYLEPDRQPGLYWSDSLLVSDLSLSARLRALADSGEAGLEPVELAEVYYMLGVLEARTVGLFSALPSMERYWEAAVRTAPQSEVAREAYALLEESAATTFSGELPFEQTDESFGRLMELRRLIGIE